MSYQSKTLELDHLVVFVSVEAPEAKTLEALGLQGFGGTTHHGDLGTASTSFFFPNTYLELFWAQDEAQARQKIGPAGIDVSARMRWRETGIAPFGLMLRRSPGFIEALPFPTKQLQADWMPEETILHFNGDNPDEPYYGVVPDNLSFLAFQANIPDMAHPLGVKEITGIKITVQGKELSPIARLLGESGLAIIELGQAPLMELTFDGGLQGKSLDVQPILPLVLKY